MHMQISPVIQPKYVVKIRMIRKNAYRPNIICLDVSFNNRMELNKQIAAIENYMPDWYVSVPPIPDDIEP